MKLDLGVSKPNRTELISLLLVIDRSTLECDLLNIPPRLIPLPTNPNRMLPQLRPKGLLYHQNRFKSLHVYVAEEPLKPPPYALPCHPEGFMNLFTVCPLQNHIAGSVRLQLHPQVLRFHQLLQILQERLVFFG